MSYYIFLTNEGSTYQPNSESIEPDCANTQVIGIASGNNEDEAFESLKKENTYLSTMSFDEVYCYKLVTKNILKYYHLKDME